MLALVCTMEDADRGVVTFPAADDLVRALARLVASRAWDEEVDDRARAIMADLFSASLSGQRDLRE